MAGGFLIGNVAPPALDPIFYPGVGKYSRGYYNSVIVIVWDSLVAPSAPRTQRTIHASDVTVRRRVTLKRVDQLSLQRGGPSAHGSNDCGVTCAVDWEGSWSYQPLHFPRGVQC
ncbi:hypothetical protein HOY80DRAFT_1037343 [Tuber brumale]|nr:hypothetical protein HOY80DRAFT_1037343 [Tuber brumale]